jgi:transcriptional regulator with XRE-family HTH domain
MHDQLAPRDPRSPENLALRRVMKRLHLSQEELARRIREDGRDTNGCNRAMVDRWVRGKTRRPQPRYLRALERVTGLPAASLGYADEHRPDHDPPVGDGTFPAGVEVVPVVAVVSVFCLSRTRAFQEFTSAQIRQISQEIIARYSSEWAGLQTLPLGR